MKQIIIIFIALLISSGVLAQGFQGVATYKTHRKLDIKLDSTQVGSEIHERMMAVLKKQFEKTYLLTFTKEASMYKEDEQLEAPRPSGMVVMVASTGGSDILYKNMKENRFTSQSEVFGKKFLVKDTLRTLDWKLENETKNIGNYTCYKATLTRTVEVVESGISVNGDKDLNANDDEEPEMRDITVTAWYTPQIPVNNGPERYQGLPGLILEVNDGQQTIVCSKVVMNPEDKVSVKEPEKGTKVNQEKFEAIIEKRMREEAERYEHNRGDDGNQSVKIRIGG